MPFDRLSFREGEPILRDATDLQKEIVRLASAHFRKIVRLVPGDYNLTPPVWKNSSYIHHLRVLENDTAIYTMEPEFEDSATLAINLEEKYERGARVFKLPEDRRSAVIMAPSRDGRILVHEVVVYSE